MESPVGNAGIIVHDMTDPLSESHNAEALNAVAVAEEARQKAMHTSLVGALREVLSDEGGSPMLIKRIPFICTDILKIKSDIGWIKWITVASVGLFGAVGLPVSGWMILQIIKNSTNIAILLHK